MLNNVLADFYGRDLQKLIDEINAFTHEADLWKIHGSIKNSAGNLALHIVGGLNNFFGTHLAHTGYVRNRDLEFSQKDIARTLIVAELTALIPLVGNTLRAMTAEDMEKPFPIMFDGAMNSNVYVLTQLALHLNYHLGQVNYLRRMLE